LRTTVLGSRTARFNPEASAIVRAVGASLRRPRAADRRGAKWGRTAEDSEASRGPIMPRSFRTAACGGPPRSCSYPSRTVCRARARTDHARDVPGGRTARVWQRRFGRRRAWDRQVTLAHRARRTRRGRRLAGSRRPRPGGRGDAAVLAIFRGAPRVYPRLPRGTAGREAGHGRSGHRDAITGAEANSPPAARGAL